MQLIRKGGFRERANRHKKHQNSENQQTTLIPQNQYQPHVESPVLPPHTQHIESEDERKTQK